MSLDTFLYTGVENPDALVAAVDLTGYEGRAVQLDGSGNVIPWTAANQTASNLVFGAGVLALGGEADQSVRVSQSGPRIRAIAGTGGVTIGAQLVPEYAASGLDRGRFIVSTLASTPALANGAFAWGVALSAADEDGEFILQLQRARVNLDG